MKPSPHGCIGLDGARAEVAFTVYIGMTVREVVGTGDAKWGLGGHLVASLVGCNALERPVTTIRRCGDFKDLRLVLSPARCVSVEKSLTFLWGPVSSSVG